MNHPKISVIVPVFNSGKYLSLLLDSILSQTFSEYELLLIDDGSTDTSPEILDMYALRDKRIKVFHKSNGGVSEARNVGISRATGDYIFFSDSDDYMYPDCLQTMYDEAKGYDLLICSYKHGDEGAFLDDKRKKTCEPRIIGSNLDDIRTNNVIRQLGYTNFVLWTQLFRRDVLKVNNLFFQKINNEDELFSYEFLSHVNSVKKIDFQGYYYIHRSGSLGSSHKYIPELDWINKMETIYKNIFIRFKIHDEEYRQHVIGRIANRYATFILKGYYADTRVPCDERIRRWRIVKQRQWMNNQISLKGHLSLRSKLVLGICKSNLFFIFDPLLVIGEYLRIRIC